MRPLRRDGVERVLIVTRHFAAFLYSLLLVGLFVMAEVELYQGDGWRTFGFGACLVCAMVLRGDLTRSAP